MAYLDPLEPAAPRPAISTFRRIKRRPRRGLALLLILCVMAVCAGGLWIGYKISAHPFASGNVPLIQADNRPTKVRPDDPGGMDIPNRGLVLNQKGGGDTEQLLPPPETPLPRPAPSDAGAQAAVTASLPPIAAAPAAPAQPTPAAPAPSPQSAQAAPAAQPPQIATAPAAVAAGTGYRLQIASVRTPEAAQQEWQRLQRQNNDLLGGLAYAAERADLGDRGVFYRIQAGPIADGASAEQICAALRQRNVGCMLVKP